MVPASTTVHLGKTAVGDEHPAVVMAEIGTFFNQDVELARSYVRKVAAAGAKIIKSEVLHDPEVCLKSTGLQVNYKHAGGAKSEDYRALVERKVVPLSRYREIYGLCKELGLDFVATVYDFEGADFLAETGAAGIKISRDNINNFPLIRHAAKTGLPLIMDAGIVYLDEAARAVRTAQEAGAAGVILNHHPGMNPAPAEANNLRVIPAYKRTLGIPIGLACHYQGDEVLYAAVALGVNLIEKGFDADPDRVEQDLVSAAPLEELPTILAKVENCWKALGSSRLVHKEPRDLSTRKGLVTKTALRKGEAFTKDNLAFAWPPVGISVEHYDLTLGKCAARELAAGTPVDWKDLSF